ncbi:hypothetical protein JTE90_013813 [Oedothorax gibbosus]|uniref:Fatty acyl-CoA reductase n=1 Tax=Oedothorax gibbosus TaxID=931172 RepID=A0AAV6VJV9_9ARAC|nr:hypothetical protein JTE90_013813 [Oedothorax gibbosus]
MDPTFGRSSPPLSAPPHPPTIGRLLNLPLFGRLHNLLYGRLHLPLSAASTTSLPKSLGRLHNLPLSAASTTSLYRRLHNLPLSAASTTSSMPLNLRRLHNLPLSAASINLPLSAASTTSLFGRLQLLNAASTLWQPLNYVLLEKLLRSCPRVRTVYVLLRPKEGQGPRERLDELLKCKVFSRLRGENPGVLRRIVPIGGDISLPELDLSQSNANMLAKQVSVVFHSAATVRFDDTLKKAVDLNLLATRRVLQLCKKMAKLVVSTI